MSDIIAGIYLRISDDREGRELGVTRQKEDCLALAERLGARVYDIYNDNDRGASRYSTKPRKDYKRLVDDAHAGRINMIIAYTTGRLTRRPREHEDQIDLAQDFGIQFSYVRSPSFDLNTSAGRRIARILASSDAGEADDISERVSEAKLKQARKGLYLGGYRGWCYEGANKDDNGIIVNRGRINVALVMDEVKIYRECVERLIIGEYCTTIVVDLNTRGIPSPDGKQWTIGNFKRTITRKRYVIFDPNGSFDPAAPEKWHGTMVHKGNEYEAVWPGLISQTEYALMKAKLNERSQPWAHGLANGRAYLLSGFIFCDSNECAIIGSRKRRSNGTYIRRYTCRRFNTHGEKLSKGHVWRAADPVEAYVVEQVLAKFDDPTVVNALTAGKADDGALREELTKLAELQAHRKQLVAEYGQRLHTLADYKAMLAACDESIAALRHEIDSKTVSTSSRNVPPLTELRRIFESDAIDRKREIIKLLVERVDLLPVQKTSKNPKDNWAFDPDFIRITWREVAMEEVAASLYVLLRGGRASFTLAA